MNVISNYGFVIKQLGLYKLYEGLFFTTGWLLNRQLTDPHKRYYVLDLGCGPDSPLSNYSTSYSVGVEIFAPYLASAKKGGCHTDLIHADCGKIEFKPGSFDAVVALDFLEHLEKSEGLALLAKMKLWAKEKVVIRVPHGYTPGQCYNENAYQLHKASYSVAELKALGFHVYGVGLKVPGYGSKKQTVDRFVRVACYPFRAASYFYPQLAYDLFGVYKKHPSAATP